MEGFEQKLSTKNRPELDSDFVPLAQFFRSYRTGARYPLAIAVEREDGLTSVYETALRTEGALDRQDRLYVDRLAKTLLWIYGGWRLIVCGSTAAGEYLAQAYAPGGSRAFDSDFMEGIYERAFTVETRPYGARPAPKNAAASVGRHLQGCRIGLDAGASNLKVSAVVDGVPAFSDSLPWRPKEQADPQYHLDHLTAALRLAAAHLPRVDGVGVSSAGVFVGNDCRAASLFLGVSRHDFRARLRDVYPKAVGALGSGIPLVVANDGDVTALAGAMGLGETGVLGISMGTSEAGGYVDAGGNITGWFNELAFVPIDVQENGTRDEWSGDLGCGVKYLSQDGAVKLADRAGIPMPQGGPADKFAHLRGLMERGDQRVAAVYRDLGIYLGHAVGLYAMFYELNDVLVMGGVAGGAGGAHILAEAQRVLREDYPEVKAPLRTADSTVCQVGQSVAAASLPETV
ncbi:MAG: ROK family protein [Pseudoflavonifractor sp.]